MSFISFVLGVGAGWICVWMLLKLVGSELFKLHLAEAVRYLHLSFIDVRSIARAEVQRLLDRNFSLRQPPSPQAADFDSILATLPVAMPVLGFEDNAQHSMENADLLALQIHEIRDDDPHFAPEPFAPSSTPVSAASLISSSMHRLQGLFERVRDRLRDFNWSISHEKTMIAGIFILACFSLALIPIVQHSSKHHSWQSVYEGPAEDPTPIVSDDRVAFAPPDESEAQQDLASQSQPVSALDSDSSQPRPLLAQAIPPALNAQAQAVAESLPSPMRTRVAAPHPSAVRANYRRKIARFRHRSPHLLLVHHTLRSNHASERTIAGIRVYSDVR